jgi:DNA-binding XRE family transcriptional regulator
LGITKNKRAVVTYKHLRIFNISATFLKMGRLTKSLFLRIHSISTTMNGAMIKQYRMLNGYSQQGIAHKLRISQQRMAEIEKKTMVTQDLLEKILAAMGKTMQDWELFVRFCGGLANR